MTFEDPKNYSVTSHDIISEIMDLDCRIPQAEDFAAEMQAQKVTAVPVAEAPAADFVTADKAAFFRFLRACGVRGSVGQISFRFTYIPESEFAGEEPQPAAGDAAPEQPAKAPAKKQPARKPAAGKLTAPKKK